MKRNELDLVSVLKLMKKRLTRTSGIIRSLHYIKKEGWNAIVAGGVLRDMYHGKAISDVDIFIEYDYRDITQILGKTVPSLRDTFWEAYWHNTLKCGAYDSCDFEGFKYAEEDDMLYAVWTTTKNGLKYQIVFVKDDPIHYVENYFDFGICKAYSDGNKIRFTDEFLKDSSNHTITLYSENLTEDQRNHALNNHLPRIQEKYSGYRLIEHIK